MPRHAQQAAAWTIQKQGLKAKQGEEENVVLEGLRSGMEATFGSGPKSNTFQIKKGTCVATLRQPFGILRNECTK